MSAHSNQRMNGTTGSTAFVATALLALPTPLSACSGCTDINLDFSYPFVRWWFQVMLLWAVLRGAAEGGLVRRSVTGISVFYAIGWWSWWSFMVPAILFTLVWVVEVMFRVQTSETQPAKLWWVTANRLCLLFIVGSLAYSHAVLATSPDRLARYARRRHPSACRRAADRLVAQGRRALPAIVEHIVSPTAQCSEDTRVRGVILAEQATGLEFHRSPDEFLAWWATAQGRLEPERWLPATEPAHPTPELPPTQVGGNESSVLNGGAHTAGGRDADGNARKQS